MRIIGLVHGFTRSQSSYRWRPESSSTPSAVGKNSRGVAWAERSSGVAAAPSCIASAWPTSAGEAGRRAWPRNPASFFRANGVAAAYHHRVAKRGSALQRPIEAHLPVPFGGMAVVICRGEKRYDRA